MILTDRETVYRVLRAISDEHGVRLLMALSEQPKSIPQVVQELGLPVTSTYRRMHALCSSGLVLKVQSTLTEDGKWCDFYQSLIRGLYMHFQGTDLVVQLIPNEGMADRLVRLWRYMKGEMVG